MSRLNKDELKKLLKDDGFEEKHFRGKTNKQLLKMLNDELNNAGYQGKKTFHSIKHFFKVAQHNKEFDAHELDNKQINSLLLRSGLQKNVVNNLSNIDAYNTLQNQLKKEKYKGKETFKDIIIHYYKKNGGKSANVPNALNSLYESNNFISTGNDPNSIYDIIDILENLEMFGKDKKALFLTIYGKDSKHVEVRQITEEDKPRIIRYLKIAAGEIEDSDESMTDTDGTTIFVDTAKDIKQYKLEFYDITGKVGGYFPYLNKVKEIDLSFAGIYHTFDEDNYTENCLLKAIREANVLTKEQIERIKISNTLRWVHTRDLKLIGKEYDICFVVSRFDEIENKLMNPRKYGNENSQKQVKLLMRENHYMIFDRKIETTKYFLEHYETIRNMPDIKCEDRKHVYTKDGRLQTKYLYLNNVIQILKDNDLLEPIKKTEYCERFTAYYPSFDDLDYDDDFDTKLIEIKIKQTPISHCRVGILTENGIQTRSGIISWNEVIYLDGIIYLRDLNDIWKYAKEIQLTEYKNKITSAKINNVVFKSLDSYFTGKDLEDETYIIEAERYMKELSKLTGLEFQNYNSLAALCWDYLLINGCFENVYKLSGKPKLFISQNIKGGIVSNFTREETLLEENIITIDLNSSYGAAMTKLQGIPQGKPKPFYKILPNDADYYISQINIKSNYFSTFYNIRSGIHFVNPIDVERLDKLDIDYDIINGYYFNEGFNNKIIESINTIYSWKTQQTPIVGTAQAPENYYIQRAAKFMIAAIYGKSISVGSKTISKTIQSENFQNFFSKNIMRIEKIIFDGNNYKCSLYKAFHISFNIPHFGAYILSQSKEPIYDILDKTNSVGIYRIMTDSITVNAKTYKEYELNKAIGNRLGEWKVEYEANKIYLINKNNYIARLMSGEYRVRGIKARKLLNNGFSF